MKLTMQEATNLLARMLKSWHIRLKRDSERHPTSGQVMLWVGVERGLHLSQRSQCLFSIPRG